MPLVQWKILWKGYVYGSGALLLENLRRNTGHGFQRVYAGGYQHAGGGAYNIASRGSVTGMAADADSDNA